jgi:hypothetical protein
MQYRHGEVVDLLPVSPCRCVGQAPASQALKSSRRGLEQMRRLNLRLELRRFIPLNGKIGRGRAY